MNSIANFFQNIGPSRKSKNGNNSEDGDDSESSEESYSKTELPPIKGQGQLTTTAKNKSYQENVNNRTLLTPGNLSPGNPFHSIPNSPRSDKGSHRLSPNLQNKSIYPVRTKTIEQIR